MKQIYILITILLLSLSNAYSQGIGGVEATISSDNIELKFAIGHLYPPISVQTVWTDDDGNQVSCDYLCDLNEVLDDIKPGRYCVQIILSEYTDTGFETNGQEEECQHGVMAITKCFDIEGSTCGTISSMMNSGISCLGDSDGTATWNGTLADCLASQGGRNNAKFQWSHGPTNHSPLTPLQEITTVNNLPPGKYCVKITPFNSVDGDCDCTAYFCTEIGSLEDEPISIRASIKPMKICYVGGKPTSVLEHGSIRVGATGGWAPNGLTFRWIGPEPPASIPDPGSGLAEEFRYCVEVSDECASKVTKCFTIPKERIECGDPGPDPDPNPNPSPSGEGPGIIVNDPGTVLAHMLDARAASANSVVESFNSVKLFPIPTSNELKIQFSSGFEGAVELVVLSIDGSIIKKGTVNSLSEDGLFTIDVSDIPSGIYYLRMEGYDTERFIIIH